MAVSQPTPATLTQNVYALDKLLADAKARVGVFLANEKAIFDAKTKINTLLSSGAAPVVNQARALAAKGDALLVIQQDAERAAQALIGQAGDLRTQMETNPIYSFLKQSPTYWGLRQYELLGNLISATATLIPAGAAITTRLLKQNGDVKTFVNEVDSSLTAAAGQGVLPSIRGVISSTIGATASSLSGVVWPIAIAAAAGLALWAAGSSGVLGRRR